MTFLHWGLAAAGIACVAIPILIHLLMRRRRKPVMWGAMRFLLEAYRRQRRRLMLEQWLLLAARCLLVLLLGLAIARPLLRGLGPAPGGRTVYLLIDNGLASTATATRGGAADDNALSRHKAAAERVLAQLATGAAGGAEVGDRVALITMGGPADPIVVPPSGDIDAVRRLVASVTPTDSRTDVAGALAIAGSAITADRERQADAARARTVVVVLSDFLEGSAELDSALPKLPDGVTVIASAPPEGRALDNISIAGVEPLRSLVIAGPGEGSAAAGEQVRVTLRRSGAAVGQAGAVGVRVRLSRPGQADSAPGALSGTGRGVVRFAAGQEEASGVVPVSITVGGVAGDGADERAGPALLEASIDADAVTGDNVWRRPVEVRRTLRVGIVALRRFGDAGRIDQLPAGEWLKLALRPAADAVGADAGAIDVADIEPGALDVGRLARLDALILPRPELLSEDMWRRVRGFVDGGGMVMVMPPADITVHTWADTMMRTLGLPWTLAREAAVVGDPSGAGSPPRIIAPPVAPGGEGGSPTDVLALLRPELEELLAPVTVFRALPMIMADNGRAPDASESLLRLEDGPVLLWAGSPREQESEAGTSGTTPGGGGGRGLVVYLGTALDLSWTDLPARPLMVPLVQELVRQGVGRARGSWWGTAGRYLPAPRRAVELVRIDQQRRGGAAAEEPAGPATLRVESAGVTAEPIRHAGAWRAVDDRGSDRGIVAVNPDPRAGAVTPQAAADVERWLRTAAGGGAEVAVLSEDQFGRAAAPGSPAAAGSDALASLLSGDDSGPPISLPLLIAAAALALIEIVLARWASHADAGPVPSLREAAA